MPKSVLNDLIPSIRKEATFRGKVWNWPFLLDIIIQSWNSELVEKAGLDPTKAPRTWDEFICERAQGGQLECRSVRRGVRRPRLALARADRPHVLHERLHAGGPVRLHERRGGERARGHEADDGGRAEEHPRAGQDRRRRQPDAGRGDLRRPPGRLLRQVPERARRASRAHGRIPAELRIAGMPKQPGGAGSTVFWNTGAALFRYGENKQAGRRLHAVTSPTTRASGAGRRARTSAARPGQLAPYQSMWARWRRTRRPGWPTGPSRSSSS